MCQLFCSLLGKRDGVWGLSWHRNSVAADRTPVTFQRPWQLIINTGTTIITFLMVFLIQNIQTETMRQSN